MSEVLTQTEVRNRFSEVTENLRRRVFLEVHFGTRGQDELAMLPSADLRELKRLAQKGAAVEATDATSREAGDPWAGLKSALKSDPMLARPEMTRERRLPRDFDSAETEAPTWDVMVRRAGAGPAALEFMRRRAQR